MKNVKLRDCTLRDGGFINDWNFGLGTIRDILYRLDKANVDFIEVGFLDDRREYDENRTIVPNTRCLKDFFKKLPLKNSQVVAMIDYETCDIDNIEDCSETPIDGIRVIFKKSKMDGALNFCLMLKNKGYKVFVQPVSITSYSDKEIIELVEKVNLIKPFGMSIVDTYGLMVKNELIRFYYLIDNNLDDDIYIGYHSHNNFQLAYSNGMELLEVKSNREIIIDSSLFGMGKGAGNANTELLALHLNNNYDKNYDINQMLEAIDINITKIFEKNSWGYSVLYYLSASNDCHPNYVKFLLDKKTLSIKSINEIIKLLNVEDKLLYNENLIIKLYREYQLHNIDDLSVKKKLKKLVDNKAVLILAPGATLKSEKDNIVAFIAENNPIIFTTNFLSKDYKFDFAFVSNAKRYGQILSYYYEIENRFDFIGTSNIVESAIPFDFVVNYSSLVESDNLFGDNSVIILLKLLQSIDIVNVSIAGFDGFSTQHERNFSDEYLEFNIANENVVIMNNDIKRMINSLNENMNIRFVTSSIFNC